MKNEHKKAREFRGMNDRIALLKITLSKIILVKTVVHAIESPEN